MNYPRSFPNEGGFSQNPKMNGDETNSLVSDSASGCTSEFLPIWALGANIKSIDHSTMATKKSTNDTSTSPTMSRTRMKSNDDIHTSSHRTTQSPKSSVSTFSNKYSVASSAPPSTFVSKDSLKTLGSNLSQTLLQKSIFPSSPNAEFKTGINVGSVSGDGLGIVNTFSTENRRNYLGEDGKDVEKNELSGCGYSNIFSSNTANMQHRGRSDLQLSSLSPAPNIRQRNEIKGTKLTKSSIRQRDVSHPTSVSSYPRPMKINQRSSSMATNVGGNRNFESINGPTISWGLYSKKRIATNPDGFPYIPSLYLNSSTSCVVNGDSPKTFSKSKTHDLKDIHSVEQSVIKNSSSMDDSSTATRESNDRMRQWRRQQFLTLKAYNNNAKFEKSSKDDEFDFSSGFLSVSEFLSSAGDKNNSHSDLKDSLSTCSSSYQNKMSASQHEVGMDLKDDVSSIKSDCSGLEKFNLQISNIAGAKVSSCENSNSLEVLTSNESELNKLERNSGNDNNEGNPKAYSSHYLHETGVVNNSQGLQDSKDGMHRNSPSNTKREFEKSPSLSTKSKKRTNMTQVQSISSSKRSSDFSPFPTASWENCLSVKAEGARSGTLHLTSTHLVFAYHDNVYFDKKLDLSQKATLINIPLDEFGEGGGFELIGNQMDQLEDSKFYENGFEERRHENEIIDVFQSGRRIISKSNNNNAQSETPSKSSADNILRNIKRSAENETNCKEIFSKSFIDKRIIHVNEEAKKKLLELDYDDDAATLVSNTASCNGNTFETNQFEKSKNPSELLEINNQSFGKDSSREKVLTHNEIREIYSNDNGSGNDDESMKAFVGIKWPLSELGEVYPRQYMMSEVALEIFRKPSSHQKSSRKPTNSSNITNALNSKEGLDGDFEIPIGPLDKMSIFLVLPDIDISGKQNIFNRFSMAITRKKRRDFVVEKIRKVSPHLNDSYWLNFSYSHRRKQPQYNSTDNNTQGFTEEDVLKSHNSTSLYVRMSRKTNPLYQLTQAWCIGKVTNFDYIIRLNALSGRSFHDPSHYPIFPWVLSNYTSKSVPDLTDKRNFRDLSKPMGALCPNRLERFMRNYSSLCTHDDFTIPPFMYGSHYSNTGGVILHYLLRKKPFAGLHQQLQGGHFDVPDRLFKSIPQTWEMCSKTSPTEVKELTPEWYSDPSFLVNQHSFDLGKSVDGSVVGDVILPLWADGNPKKFISFMRMALESDICSSGLPSWIDLIFGCKQRGFQSHEVHNVFYHLTYLDAKDISEIEDHELRTETVLHINNFGSCPSQLFHEPHPSRNKSS
eukprot:CAMPEP_0184861764 /NCGR_PEP_ID=MMETSP0580-20130426/6372_1 /TAXON_ID=1118495 /ORGANISM="Dactyliosolen fragilissimus" /LENGTH=1288 /DNA_ID=CAMNT_0027359369 /DNA_START=241 /DNA_END=4107 /DNA_ORIENTATION=+